jgi:hypothetical protein
MANDRDKRYADQNTPSFDLKNIRAASDDVRQAERERQKDAAFNRTPTAKGLEPKSVSFPDLFLKCAKSRLLGNISTTDALLFTFDVAEADPTISFRIAMELADRISRAPTRTGGQQHLARRARSALEAARTELVSQGEPGEMLAEVVRLAED